MRIPYRTVPLAVLFLAASAVTAAAAAIPLPPPEKTGGMPLFEALERRASVAGRAFPAASLTAGDLSTILWAASGINRDGTGWTVPRAMGVPPYCMVFLTSREGVFLYDWREHSLLPVSDENVHASIPMQEFAQNSPVNLYIVADGSELGLLANPFSDEFGLVLAGAMSQNIHLACESLGVAARIVYTIRRGEAMRALRLEEGDIPYFAVVLGKKDKPREDSSASEQRTVGD